MTTARLFLIFALVVASAPGCVASSRASTSVSERTGFRRPELITRAEFDNRSFASAYDVIVRLRPAMLQARRGSARLEDGDGEPAVYIDNMRAGGLSQLAGIDVREVYAIRYYSAIDARTVWRTTDTVGVIQIVTRH